MRKHLEFKEECPHCKNKIHIHVYTITSDVFSTVDGIEVLKDDE